MNAHRRLALVLGVALIVAWPTGVTEAQSPRPVKIGALTDSWGPTPSIVGLRDGLQELGYQENQDFVIGVRFTQGNVADLPQAARALVRHGVHLIVTTTDDATKAAQMATARIPIVFTNGDDPLGQGLVKSFARPAGNITGIADLQLELVPKRMEIFRDLVPGLKRVLLVYDATTVMAPRLDMYRAVARRLGLVLVERPVRTEDEARSVISAARKSDVDGIFSPRSLALNIPGLIHDIGPKRGLPAMFDDVYWVERGGLASYAANLHGVGRQAARLVDKILKGAKPGDVPVEQPTKLELVVNVKAAKALGITIPQAVLLRAERLIE